MPESFTSTSFTSTSYTIAAAGAPGIISFASQSFPRLIRTDFILSRKKVNQVEKIKVLKNIPISQVLQIPVLKSFKIDQEQKITIKRIYDVSFENKLRVQLPHKISQISSLFVRKKQVILLSTIQNISVVQNLSIDEIQSIPVVKLAQINNHGIIEVIDPQEIVSAIQAVKAVQTLGSARSTLAGFLPVEVESLRGDSISLGVQRVIWKTQGDAKVCPICDALEGNQYDIDDPDKPIPIDDTHPHCRCEYEDVLTGAVVDF